MFVVVVLLGALGGYLALIWRLSDLWTEERGRLSVASTRSLTGGVDALIQYRPRRTRVGLSAKVTLLEPAGAHLVGGVRQERGDRYGAYAVGEPDQMVKGRSVETPLRHLRPDPQGVFAGVIYVGADEGEQPSSARIRLEIWTAAGPTRLATRDVSVSAINW
jgi:hypothetical protein